MKPNRDKLDYIPDGQMNIFDMITSQQTEADEQETVQSQLVYSDYEWHDMPAIPPDRDFCLFEYTYARYRANDTTGQCYGWWDNDRQSVIWHQMPMDIGKKTITRWVRVPEWLKPLFSPECDHNHKCMCNRWNGTQEERDKRKSELSKGYSCSGCCWYCQEAPQHGGKCKHECRVFKDDLKLQQG